MSKKKYKTSQDVLYALQKGVVKRNSLMVMKRSAKSKNDLDYTEILQSGIELYDDLKKNLTYCSYYKKDINSLSLYELVELEDNKPELFSYYHKVRYSILMLGEIGTDVESYQGMVITPMEIREL